MKNYLKCSNNSRKLRKNINKYLKIKFALYRTKKIEYSKGNPERTAGNKRFPSILFRKDKG